MITDETKRLIVSGVHTFLIGPSLAFLKFIDWALRLVPPLNQVISKYKSTQSLNEILL